MLDQLAKQQFDVITLDLDNAVFQRTADALNFDGKDMLKLSNRQRRQIVGKDLAMVFQDPMTALNPSYTVGFQIEEVLRLHLKMSGKQARKRAIELLEKVEIPGAASQIGRAHV